MAITSVLEPGEVMIVDWQAAGLLRESAFKPLFAIFEQRTIARQLGTLTESDRAALKKLIGTVLG
jgi:mRNA interferase MazF